MDRNVFFCTLFNYLHDDDLLCYKSLCDLKKSVKSFYILRRGSDLFSELSKKYYFDFKLFFKDYDFDDYLLLFVFDILFKYWFSYSFDIDFVDFLNCFHNYWRLMSSGKKA